MARGRRIFVGGVITVLACLLLSFAASGADSGATKRVLILHSYGRDFAPFSFIAAPFRTELAQRSPYALEFHEASLEEKHEPADADRPLVTYLHEVFASRPPDLIVTIAEPSSLFLGRNRARLFPDTPAVSIVNQRLVSAIAAVTNTTVVPIEVQIPVLMENILAVLPQTTNVMMVLGSSPFELYWRAQCQQEFAPFTNKVTISYANELSLERIQERAHGLPAGSAILYATLMRDGAGVPHEEERALERIHEVASVPVFGVLEHQLGNGIIGGRLLSMESLGRELAHAGAELLQGKKPASGPSTGPSRPVYDWRELRRWQIDERRLPVASEIKYRVPTFWEQYKTAIIALSAICVVEAMLILGLVKSRRRLRRAQGELFESDQRMSMASKAAKLGLWVWEVPVNGVWLSENCRAIFEFQVREEVTIDKMRSRVHPEDRAMRESILEQALHQGGGYELQYRLLLPNGITRWVASSGRAELDAQGKRARVLGVIMDITERRRAEETAREVSGRLITAQEDERRRIARDLHDDLNQRLAMLSVELELYGQENPSNGNGDGRMQEMVTQVKELSSEVHRLAYQLHPAKLDQLGLVAAARSFCREIAEQSDLPVEFRHQNVPADLAPEISLCLYRVIQESLRNVVRHSGATKVSVEIIGERELISLRVSDNGKGFVVAEAMRRSGLGLVSMEERIRLLHGTISVKSEPDKGTIIELGVPLSVQKAIKI